MTQEELKIRRLINNALKERLETIISDLQLQLAACEDYEFSLVVQLQDDPITEETALFV